MPNVLLARRLFLKHLAAASGLTLCAGSRPASAAHRPADGLQLGVLIDTTMCVGCRSCERACNEINTDLPRRPPELFKDEAVFAARRRMDAGAYTVVNRYLNSPAAGRPVYAKFQCLHCLYPACESACIVGALSRQDNGAVVYDAGKCIGCRYCLAACPFQVPAYEYGNALTPQIRKCTFCFDQRLRAGAVPACVEACPTEVMIFGKRSELLGLARQRIRQYPGRYRQHIYGEHEAGGTAWLYLAGVPFKAIDLPGLGYHPIPGYTEPIQHAIFKWFAPPAALYGLLGGLMWWLTARRRGSRKKENCLPKKVGMTER